MVAGQKIDRYAGAMSDTEDPKVVSIFTGKERPLHVDKMPLEKRNADCIKTLENALKRARQGDISRVMLIFENEEDTVFTFWSCMNERDALYLVTMLQHEVTGPIIERMGAGRPFEEDDPAV